MHICTLVYFYPLIHEYFHTCRVDTSISVNLYTCKIAYIITFICILVWWHAHLVTSLHVFILGNLYTFNLNYVLAYLLTCIFMNLHTLIPTYFNTCIYLHKVAFCVCVCVCICVSRFLSVTLCSSWKRIEVSGVWCGHHDTAMMWTSPY